MPERDRPPENTYRETYREHATDSGTIAVIADPENPLAWIRSSVTVPVEQ